MNHPNLLLLYVEDPATSSLFYAKLLQKAPTVSFPTYVAFELNKGLTLGLWSTQQRKTEPAAPAKQLRSNNKGYLRLNPDSPCSLKALQTAKINRSPSPCA